MSSFKHTSRRPSANAAPTQGLELLSMVGIFMFSFRQWVRTNLPTDGGMTAPRATMLIALANKRDKVGMSELGELNGLSPRSMTVLVDGLEKEGLVERFPHESDRRITLIGITEAGSRLVKMALGPSQIATAALFDDLTPDEQRELARLLAKLFGAFQNRGVDVPARDERY